MKPQNLLTVDDVRITTATVEIQVIRIGAKQMTLAVFRQLPHKDIFDEWGNLLAPAWGWVNYEANWYSTPFIFSHEGVLYRDNVEDLTAGRNLVEIEFTHPGPAWRITLKREYYVTAHLNRFSFDSKKAAQDYLANRNKNHATLREAPQLFIAV